MFRNWCHFPKLVFSENDTCVKTEGVAVIQTSFSDRTNVFLAMTTIRIRIRIRIRIIIRIRMSLLR